MKKIGLALVLCSWAGMAVAQPLTFNEAKRALPNAGKRVSLQTYPDRLPASDAAKFEAAGMKISQVFKGIGATLEGYGAVAISPDEGMVVEWLSGVSQHHSIDAARKAAVDYCNAKKRAASAPCVVVAEVIPRGAKPGAALSLSNDANAALRKAYRKLKAPKAFAISPSQGSFGYDRGDGGRALEACARSGARDCRVVVADQ